MSNRFSVPGIEITANDELTISNIVATNVNPITTGLDYPVGTYALNINGSIYFKYGAGNFDWSIYPIFGSNYQVAQSLNELSTNSTDFVSNLILTTPNLPLGNYRLNYSYYWRASTTNRDAEFRVLQNNTTTLMTHLDRATSNLSDRRFRISGVIYLPSISGVNTFDLQWRTSQSASTVSIGELVMDLWRVS